MCTPHSPHMYSQRVTETKAHCGRKTGGIRGIGLVPLTAHPLYKPQSDHRGQHVCAARASNPMMFSSRCEIFHIVFPLDKQPFFQILSTCFGQRCSYMHEPGAKHGHCVFFLSLLLPWVTNMWKKHKKSNADNRPLSWWRASFQTKSGVCGGGGIRLLSSIKIFFIKTTNFSTPTVQTNTVTALPLMASPIGEVTRSIQAFHTSLTDICNKKSFKPTSHSFTNLTNVLWHTAESCCRPPSLTPRPQPSQTKSKVS